MLCHLLGRYRCGWLISIDGNLPCYVWEHDIIRWDGPIYGEGSIEIGDNVDLIPAVVMREQERLEALERAEAHKRADRLPSTQRHKHDRILRGRHAKKNRQGRLL